MEARKYLNMITLKEMDISDITDEYISSLNNPELNKYTVVKKVTKEDCVRYINQHKFDPFSKMYGIFEIIDNNSEKALVGTMTLKNIDFLANNALFGIFVWKTGKKIGATAIALAKKELKKMGISKMSLGVHPENKAAIKCYKNSGFFTTGLIMSMTWDECQN